MFKEVYPCSRWQLDLHVVNKQKKGGYRMLHLKWDTHAMPFAERLRDFTGEGQEDCKSPTWWVSTRRLFYGRNREAIIGTHSDCDLCKLKPDKIPAWRWA